MFGSVTSQAIDSIYVCFQDEKSKLFIQIIQDSWFPQKKLKSCTYKNLQPKNTWKPWFLDNFPLVMLVSWNVETCDDLWRNTNQPPGRYLVVWNFQPQTKPLNGDHGEVSQDSCGHPETQ